jgi:hypothetical protein
LISMFDEPSEPKREPGRIFHLVISWATSFLVFALLIYVVLLLLNVVPADQSREYKRRAQRRQEILAALNIEVSQAGFIKRRTSSQRDMYTPQLVIQISNTSSETFTQLSLECRFSRKGQFICGGRVYANDLKPGEGRKITLKCTELMLTGAIVYGIGLGDAEKGLDYEVTLVSEDIRVVVFEGRLAFKLL